MWSHIEPIAFENVSVDDTMNGESGEVDGIFDDDPMCMQSVVSVSWSAAKNGSQKRSLSCTDGNPSGYGFSLKATAGLPLSAQRRTSAAASSASQSGTIVSGMRMPLPSPPHHSSIIQSL